MRTDNNEHKALFTIPTAAYSSTLANIKPLPEQRRITGHKQTDAYLWVLEVIRLAKLPPIPLKAVLTASNQEWDTHQLYEELKKEREAIAAQKAEKD